MDNGTVRYEGHRRLTLAVHRIGDSAGEVGDFHAGVVEWGMETGASLPTEAMALEFARAAADAGIDAGKAPTEALALPGAEPVALSAKWLVVETESGPAQVFYNGEASDPDEDPTSRRSAGTSSTWTTTRGLSGLIAITRNARKPPWTWVSGIRRPLDNPDVSVRLRNLLQRPNLPAAWDHP